METKFKEDGTAYICVDCDSVAELIIDGSGVQPKTPSGPEIHWFWGKLKCNSCGYEEYYTDSSD
jgi:hypothetical protein